MSKLIRFLLSLLALVLVWNLLAIRQVPEKNNFGVSFSVFHSNELKLNWKEAYQAILNDLNVRNFRFSAHWPLTQPVEGKFNFEELDYQIAEADKKGATYILAVGRRLPGWPECHIPDWLKDDKRGIEYENEKLFEYIEKVVERYKNSKGLRYWQVENEPFLSFFGRSNCPETDETFLKKEIELVRKLDPNHEILLTDSGEFGQWYKAYRNADVFGSSLYLYVWWKWQDIGPIRYPIGPSFFRVKQNLANWIYGKKPIILVEMEAEPWLTAPIVDTPIETQLEQMNLERFMEIVNTSKKAGFEDIYMWGAEWWYWLKNNGKPEIWEKAKTLF